MNQNVKRYGIVSHSMVEKSPLSGRPPTLLSPHSGLLGPIWGLLSVLNLKEGSKLIPVAKKHMILFGPPPYAWFPAYFIKDRQTQRL